jgi:hypothetical protein
LIKALAEQPGADQQHQRQCELRNHQQTANALAQRTAGIIAPGFFERRLQINHAAAKRRKNAEEKRRHHR